MNDPVEDGDEVIATRLTRNDIALRVDFADRQLLVQSTNEQHCQQKTFLSSETNADEWE